MNWLEMTKWCCRFCLVTIVVGLLLPISPQADAAQERYTSWRLTSIQTKDHYHPGGAQTFGSITIDEFHADAMGGFVRLRAKRPTACPPGAGLPKGSEVQRFKFSWRFEQDVSRMYFSRGPIGVWLTIEGDKGTSCMDQNPFMQFGGDRYLMVHTPGGEARFYFKPTHSFHVPNPRTIRVDRKEDLRKDGFFQITISDFRHDPTRGFRFFIIYAYEGETSSPPQCQTFSNPMIQGYRLDWCLKWGEQCGEPAATAWCRTQGFERATEWNIAQNVPPTYILGDRQVCNQGYCGGFSRITCCNGSKKGLDLNNYCGKKFGRNFRARNPSGGCHTWICTDGQVSHGMDINEACRMRYGSGYRALARGQGASCWECIR